MSSFTRRIQRSVKRKPYEEDGETKFAGVHFGGRGATLGQHNAGDKCKLAREVRDGSRAARQA